MNIVDILILVVLISGAFLGFARGFFKQSVMFVGTILVVLLSFIFKNPLSLIMYKNLPFFKFGGLTSLNILLYETLAFIIALVVLSIVLFVIIKITGIVESVLKITVVLAIPSKILGLIVGVIQSVVVLYVFLFLVSLPILKVPYVNDSKYAKIILEKTPFISRITDGVVKTFDEISKFSDENLNKNYDSKKANKEMLEIMLKNKVITVENVRILSDKSKIEVDNINELLEKYKEE